MKKILFYTANGVGLGHLKRASLIAKELKSKNIEIILVTSAKKPEIFGSFFNHLIKLNPVSDKLAKDFKIKKVKKENTAKFVKALKRFRPDLVIADFYLTSSFTFSVFGDALGKVPTKSIFIWRLGEGKKFKNDFKNGKNKLECFEKIILPHSEKELGFLLGESFLKKIKQNKQFFISEPVFEKINKKIIKKDFLITLTVGAGGKLAIGKCDNPKNIIKIFLKAYPILKEKILNLKVIIATGPYLEKFNKKNFSNVKFVKFEKNLFNLIKESKLVISASGYNTCNEIIQAKTPTILIPLLRGDKEQLDRAKYLEKMGIAKIFKNGTPKDFSNLIIKTKKDLKEMENNFKNFSDLKSGNKKVAKIILEELEKKEIDLKHNPYLPDNKNFLKTRNVEVKIDFKKKNSKPRFSVIIPTYNRKESLKLVLKSFFEQNYQKLKYEVIVVDDGSTDDTEEMIKKLKTNCNFKYIYWPRPKIELKKENKKLAKFYNRAGPARNIGVEHAKGEIILFNDSDILVESDCLKKHEKYHNKYSNIIVRGFRMNLPKTKNNKILKNKAIEEKSKGEREIHCKMYNLSKEGWQRIVTCNLSIRKKYFKRTGGFSRDFVFWGGEDVDLGYRLKKLNLKFIWDENIKVYHIWHKKESGTKEQQLEIFKINAQILYNKYKDREIINIFTDVIKRKFGM